MFKLLFIFTFFFIVSCDSGLKNSKNIVQDNSSINALSLKTDSSGLSTSSATLKTIHGDIIFRFYTKAAPRTVSRIMQLIQSKFYDGLIIHRAIPNFIIQMGDPSGLGNGGSGVKLKPEFSELQHIKGTIGMARSLDVNSADSQFYICLTTLSHLDGKNTIFAQVVEGLDILNKLSKGDRIISITLNLKN